MKINGTDLIINFPFRALQNSWLERSSKHKKVFYKKKQENSYKSSFLIAIIWYLIWWDEILWRAEICTSQFVQYYVQISAKVMGYVYYKEVNVDLIYVGNSRKNKTEGHS